MRESRLIGSVDANTLAAFYLFIMLTIVDASVAPAQCSQATQPEKAPAVQSTSSAQNGALTTVSGQSSSSDATREVRFVTGRAITVLEDTPLQVVNDLPISSRNTKTGAKLSFTVTSDVVVDGILVIPCGATVLGTVLDAKQAGRLVGSSKLTLELTTLNLAGKSYPLYTPPFKVVGQSKTSPTLKKMTTGAAVGTIATDIDSRIVASNVHVSATEHARADGLGATVGAGVGTVIAAASPPSIALIPAESQIEFTLASPVAVFPVDQHTAMQLAQGMHQGGPVLYLRGESQ
ncbi:MAG: hypothetical protein ABSA39_21650 [Edaphobacter sp.]|uniref:hypothetical protein n=1 Tax=Terracidiphilus sp. TaxID=1964191 RepID=UPI003C15531F